MMSPVRKVIPIRKVWKSYTDPELAFSWSGPPKSICSKWCACVSAALTIRRSVLGDIETSSGSGTLGARGSSRSDLAS